MSNQLTASISKQELKSENYPMQNTLISSILRYVFLPKLINAKQSLKEGMPLSSLQFFCYSAKKFKFINSISVKRKEGQVNGITSTFVLFCKRWCIKGLLQWISLRLSGDHIFKTRFPLLKFDSTKQVDGVTKTVARFLFPSLNIIK